MKFLKPPWVNHGGSSSRNVLDPNDCILEEEARQTILKERLNWKFEILPEVGYLSSCNPIFAIDFHPKGKKFATGGQGEDSGRVAIWNVLPVFSAKIENDENVPKLLCQMDNHLANVNCVRWSYSGEFLASAGDDKLVMIWQLSQYGGGSIFGSSQVAAESWRCVATLNAHEGDILDLSWSPNDSKLASASVDNDIIIWNMRTSKPERLKTLKGHTGFVKGVSFDPIGKFLASQADDKTLRIWRTSDWKEEKVVKTPFEECSGTTPVLRLDWSPEGQFLISAHAMNGGGPTAQIVDRDGWKTDRDVVGHRKAVTCVLPERSIRSRINLRRSVLSGFPQILKEPVLDLSWDNSGKRLLACSWDGTVACIEFKKEELGEMLAKEDRDAYFKRLYGTSYANDQPVRVIRENPIVEPLPDLPLHDRTTSTAPVLRASGQTLRDDGQDWSNQSALATKNVRPATPTAKQVETRLADGRRRITPMFLPPPTSAMSEIPIAPSVNGQTIFSSSAEPSSRIQIERQEKQPSTASHPLEEDRGEKRPLDGLPDSFVVKKPRLLSVPPTPQKAERGLAVRFEGGSGTRIRLPALQPRKTYTVSIDFAGRALTVESVNDAMASGRDNLHRLTGFSTGSKVWEQVFSSKIVALEASNRIVCAATQDGNLHMFTPEGNRRFPPIVTSGVSSLNLLHHFVFLLATDGRVNVWDVKVGRATCRNVSVEDLCGHAPRLNDARGNRRNALNPDAEKRNLDKSANAQISCCKITENGMPVVSVSNGKSFAYCSNLESWMELASSEDPVSRSSDIQASDILAKESKEFSLSSLARSSSGQRPRPAVRCSAEVQSVCTQSYLEQQMCASLSVESSSEYRAWLHALVRHLSSVAAEQQLRSICKDLLGPLYQSPSWKPDVLGISKHGLLKEVLQIISQQVRLQRLYCEFTEQLKMNTSLTQS